MTSEKCTELGEKGKRNPREVIYPRALYCAIRDEFGVDFDPNHLTSEWFSQRGLLTGLVVFYKGDVDQALSQTREYFAYSHKLLEEEAPEERGIPFEFVQEPLLSHEEEIALAQMREQGREARKKLSGERTSDSHGNGRYGLERSRLEKLVEGGRKAENYLITCNYRLIVKEARKYSNAIGAGVYKGKHLEPDELVDEGFTGLMIAVNKFKWRKGFRFSTYATWWIRQKIQRAIVNQGAVIRTPNHIHDALAKIHRAEQKIAQRGETVDSGALIQETGFEEKTIKKLEVTDECVMSPLSLDVEVGDDGDSNLGDFVEDDQALDPMEETGERDGEQHLRVAVQEAMEFLTGRERKIIEMRFFRLGKKANELVTLEAIAKEFGLSRERIRQIERDAKAKMEPVLADYLKGLEEREEVA